MKKRYVLLLAAVVVCAGLCLWLLNGDGICIGRMETRTDDQWSQLHVYMNEEITVDFPVDGEDRVCLFQYETGRGSFTVKITDAEGNTVYSDTADDTGSASFLASSDLKLRIKADGHGGTFSLLQREKPVLYPGEALPTYGYKASDTHTGGKFTATYDLRQADGRYLNFYVENRGIGPVVISINGEYDLTIPPGLAGHISAPISAAIMPQPMTVKCASTSGEDINIFWSVAQRRNNTT
ncbi:MAG: hypothetical protein IJO05_01825 [Oscillospiraceae bacterium]|nr:hypothetical protein [Oscillospiraceae bacterium]